MTNFTILAIESSCDETSAAVLHNGKVLNNVIATQSVHENYGGVVPELASRAHQQNIVPTVAEALKGAALKTTDLSAVAFTRGPGLLGSLLVGTSFAKGLALAHNIPLIEVNHMQAHVLAHFIEDPKPAFPFLCLTVSGGHTQLVKVTGPLEMEVIGQTQDDAVGEAFDKAAKMFGLPYPGGPHLDRLAQEGNPEAFPFTETEMPDLDFSFSGIKTGILYFLQKQERTDPDFVQKNLPDLCASVQKALVNMLLKKLKKAVKQTGIQQVAIAGGVSANSGLRNSLLALGEKHCWQVYIPKFEYCTDNAAMIAKAAEFKYQAGEFVDQSISPLARMPL
ncbi:MAG: tRNA (adenosine(37)-N6)-threonylcarbamoyltransferase complex transferase subunit TsaD [Bacteroidota bacterium]